MISGSNNEMWVLRSTSFFSFSSSHSFREKSDESASLLIELRPLRRPAALGGMACVAPPLRR